MTEKRLQPAQGPEAVLRVSTFLDRVDESERDETIDSGEPAPVTAPKV